MKAITLKRRNIHEILVFLVYKASHDDVYINNELYYKNVPNGSVLHSIESAKK